MSAVAVSLQGLKKSFGVTAVVHDFSLDIVQGELVALLGPSGCGKTTVLRMVAGFETPDAGRVLIQGADVTALAPGRRNAAMVFQRYALFPHLTVRQNIAFGLEMRRTSRADKEKRIDDMLALVRLEAYGTRLPHQLSGGQQQRVAIARALAIAPDALLLDEPLSNLDAKLRVDVRQEIRSLQQKLGLTTLLVTHDQEEAMTMADRVVVIEQGRIQQVGTPHQVYEAPANRYVAGFLGRMNFLEGRVERGTFRSAAGTALQVADGREGTLTLGIRPERIALAEPDTSTEVSPFGGPADNTLGVTLVATVFLGSVVELHVQTDAGEALVCHRPNTAASGAPQLEAGRRLTAHLRRDDCIPLQ